MSILNTEEISNPDIRLNQTNTTPIVQFCREAMFTPWMHDGHIWPEWALQIRYGGSEDPIRAFYKFTKNLEQFIAGRIGLFRIDDIEGQLKHLVNLMFQDIYIINDELKFGTGYFIHNKRTKGIVMSIVFVRLGE